MMAVSRCVHNPARKISTAKEIVVMHCKIADQEHAESKRQYAHVFHYPNRICVARAINELTDSWRLAILLHEVGHLLAGPKGSEAAANKAVEKASGIPILYEDGPFGENLERILRRNKKRAIDFLETGE